MQFDGSLANFMRIRAALVAYILNVKALKS